MKFTKKSTSLVLEKKKVTHMKEIDIHDLKNIFLNRKHNLQPSGKMDELYIQKENGRPKFSLIGVLTFEIFFFLDLTILTQSDRKTSPWATTGQLFKLPELI